MKKWYLYDNERLIVQGSGEVDFGSIFPTDWTRIVETTKITYVCKSSPGIQLIVEL